MNNFLQLLLIATLTVSSSASPSTLRGSTADVPEEDRLHRHLTKQTKCKLFLRSTDYSPTADHPRGYSEEDWVCQLNSNSKDGARVRYVDIVDPENTVRNATSGISILTVNETVVDIGEDTTRMYISRNALVDVSDYDDDGIHRRRKLAESKGVLTALIVRVSAKDAAPTHNSARMINDVFEDDSCLASQYNACSYGKLQIKPFVGKNLKDRQVNGIIEVKVDYALADNAYRSVLQNKAYEALEDKLGDLNDPKFDLIMFCMPPGTGDWLAYALVNNKFSFYNDEWCGYVSAQVHEVGHNIALAHSGQVGEGYYDDQSGVMGFSHERDDDLICFNPAKNYQLGWYDDKVKDYNPLDGNKPLHAFTMNGVSDYTKNAAGTVVVRLEQPDMLEDFYIGYNRKDGINMDTKEDGDRITIVQKAAGFPKEYGQSLKQAALNLGESYIIKDFNGQRNVTVKFTGIANNGRDATIEVIDVENYGLPPKVPCVQHTIELMTDPHPEDNYWTITEVGGIGESYGISPEDMAENKLHSTIVCLPYEKKYLFRIVDTYEEGGMCSGGYFRVLDRDDQEIFGGGGGLWNAQEYEIVVGPDLDSGGTPDPKTEPECNDAKGKFTWHERKNRKRTCKWIAKKNKCFRKFNGAELWRKCPAACEACTDM